MCKFLKDFIVPIATTLLGVVGGFVAGIFAENWRRRWRPRDDFAEAVYAIRCELIERGEQINSDFIAWHAHAVHKLSAHARYFEMHQPDWWRKVEAAWKDYEATTKLKDPAVLLLNKIDTKVIRDRLDALLHQIRASHSWISDVCA